MMPEREIASRVTELLDYATTRIDTKAVDRLQSARQSAVELASVHVHVAPAETALAGAGRYFAEHFRHSGYALTALFLLVLLVLAFQMMQQQHAGPLEADALLLASDLPPEAYIDQGFDTWLKRSSQP